MVKKEDFKTKKHLEEIIKSIFQNDYSGACYPVTKPLSDNSDNSEFEYYLYYDPETGSLFVDGEEACEFFGEKNAYDCERFTATVNVEADAEMYEWEKEDGKDYEQFEHTVSELADLWEDKFGKLPVE